MRRSTVVSRADHPGQCGPVHQGTPIFVLTNAGTHKRIEQGYFNLSGLDKTEFTLIGVTQIMIPADQDEMTVVLAGEIVVPIDPFEKLRKDDKVQVEVRGGVGVFTKARALGPEYLVAPGSNASQGLGLLTGAIAEAAVVGLNLTPAQVRQARTNASNFVVQAMKAKKPTGSRVAQAKGVRDAQNGGKLLIQAIKMANASVFGKITKVGKKGKSAAVMSFKN